MLSEYRNDLEKLLIDSLKGFFPDEESMPSIEVDVPSNKEHGDFATNICLKSARILKKSPMDIAPEFVDAIKKEIKKGQSTLNCSINVLTPGFINFHLDPIAVQEVLSEVHALKEAYGKSDMGQLQKIQVEFVSANPTGPLSIAHARQAVVGDVLVNILNYLGFAAEREYYVNDGGNQINILGQSLRLRALEILGQTVEFPQECYQGEYIKDIAGIFLKEKKIKNVTELESRDKVDFNEFATEHILNLIKEELADFGVHFDCWTHESVVATQESIEKILVVLAEKKLTYEKEGALWFRSQKFGDDKDRVLRKNDGSYTYLTPDIVYHKNKFDRGFERIFNIWGPDHHGYIPRIKAAVQALGHEPKDLDVLIVQLATIYRAGKTVSMSTRRGQYISLREVMEEVGVDAARFFFLMRHIKAHLDFDLDLAKKETPENPVYYIQYAHARIYSINAKAIEAGVEAKLSGYSLLKEEEEIDLIKKIGSFGESLTYCYEQLDPYPLVSYLHELAISFHKFYDRHKVIGEDPALSAERLGLVNAARIVIANGLHLVGVSSPEKM